MVNGWAMDFEVGLDWMSEVVVVRVVGGGDGIGGKGKGVRNGERRR